ncbi:MAG: iron-sulfur cluster co-chaperone HscB C-terminal domain-containing protein, partial [Gammaproteobacteria bacterium]
REALEEAGSAATVEDLADAVAATRRRMLAELQQTADVQRDWSALAQQVRALMFVERFARDVEARLEQLGQ